MTTEVQHSWNIPQQFDTSTGIKQTCIRWYYIKLDKVKRKIEEYFETREKGYKIRMFAITQWATRGRKSGKENANNYRRRKDGRRFHQPKWYARNDSKTLKK